MKAEERAERLCKQRGIYMGYENAIVGALRAHANEALEAAAKVAEYEGMTDIPPDASSDYERGMHETALLIANRLRALKE